ncbi:MAG TPA: methionyl-tRNA formyltransferase, partial [Acidothermaceae bacterium]
VITRPDAPAGRGRHEVVSPVAQHARAAGIDVVTPSRPSDPAFLDHVTALRPDCIAVVAYGALIPASALAIPMHGWVNLHFSLLPAWRGAAPVQHAILHGDDITGATTFVLEAGLDTGPVLGMLTEPIGARDTAGDVLGRLAIAGAGLLLATLDGLDGATVSAVAQSADGVSLAPKLTSADARIDWNTPAMHVDRLVRACTPAPGAWTTFRGRRMKVAPVLPATSSAGSMRAGSVSVVRDGGEAVFVGTATGPVLLTAVQTEGKAMTSAAAWARGARLTADDSFI